MVVTGSGTGIGRGIAVEMASQGAGVVLHYLRGSEGALSAVEEIAEAGGKATAFPADFREMTPRKELADKGLDFLGGCDVLVNNQEPAMGVDFDWEDNTKVVPVGFCAEPKDIVELTIFLASGESRYILG